METLPTELTYKLENIDEVALKLIDLCKHKNFLFYGEMGAGKTTLIRAILRAMNVKDAISSPTFSLLNEYENTDGESIYHFDFYRINGRDEGQHAGLFEYFDPEKWIFIEWPENINSIYPYSHHQIRINSTNNEDRILLVS